MEPFVLKLSLIRFSIIIIPKELNVIPFRGFGAKLYAFQQTKAPKHIVQGLLIEQRITPIVITFIL